MKIFNYTKYQQQNYFFNYYTRCFNFNNTLYVQSLNKSLFDCVTKHYGLIRVHELILDIFIIYLKKTVLHVAITRLIWWYFKLLVQLLKVRRIISYVYQFKKAFRSNNILSQIVFILYKIFRLLSCALILVGSELTNKIQYIIVLVSKQLKFIKYLQVLAKQPLPVFIL